MTLTELAIKRPAAVAMFFLLIAILGILMYQRLPVDILPSMEWPWVVIVAVWPGAGPQEVESTVSKPLENAVVTLNKLKHIRTYNNENVSTILLEFDMSANADVVLQETQRMVNATRAQLPEDAKEPMLFKADMAALPILQIAISSPLSGPDLHDLIDQKIVPRLQQIDGVGQVIISGAEVREIQVAVDPEKLKTHGLTLGDLNGVIAGDNLDVPAGKVFSNSQDLTLRLAGKYKTVSEIGLTRVPLSNGSAIYLRDVATITDTIQAERSLARLNGESALGLQIVKQGQANSVKTAGRVRNELAKIEKDYSGLLKIEVAQDITQFTRDAISGVQRNVAEALVVVALVLLVFLHSLRSSFIVLIAIPLSLISTFLALKLFNASINLMTLMAMSMVVGVLVDDSIVVLENIHRWMKKGVDPVTAAVKGRNEIGLAAVSITMVDVVVFLPVALLTGMVGKIFREFSIAFVATVLMSLLVSFTVAPLLASRLNSQANLEGEKWLRGFGRAFERWFARLEAGYEKLLGWALDHRGTVIGMTTILMVGAIALVPLGFIGTDFFPQVDRGEFAVLTEMPLGTPLKENDVAVMKIENFIRGLPEATDVYAVIGNQSTEHGDETNPRLGNVMVKLKGEQERKRSTNQVKNEIVKFAHAIPGMTVTINDIGIFGMANAAPIQYEVRGQDLDSVAVAVEHAMEALRKIPGTRDVQSTYEPGSPELQVIVDREKAAASFLTPGEVAMALRNAVNGQVATRFRTGDVEVEVKSILAPRYRSDPALVGQIEIRNHWGQMVKLSDVARIQRTSGPASIQRKDRQRLVTVSANIQGRSLGEIQKDLETEMAKYSPPVGVSFYSFGDVENMRQMMSDMTQAIGLSILFVYMILVVLYESYVHPFTVMFSVPVALVGALLGLAITGKSLSMFSMIAILILMGLVTKNGILLVDFTNQLRARGLPMRDALLKAGPLRLRPILMTTFTMVVGMTPLAIGLGAGGEMRSGMGVVVIGGLLSSLLLTLVLVPVMYTIMDRVAIKKPATVETGELETEGAKG